MEAIYSRRREKQTPHLRKTAGRSHKSRHFSLRLGGGAIPFQQPPRSAAAKGPRAALAETRGLTLAEKLLARHGRLIGMVGGAMRCVSVVVGLANHQIGAGAQFRRDFGEIKR
jgi:hypothetical protein